MRRRYWCCACSSDAQVQQLFDHIVERWRVSGNIVLTAGTDLANRTLDTDDIFTFIDGGLSGRFKWLDASHIDRAKRQEVLAQLSG